MIRTIFLTLLAVNIQLFAPEPPPTRTPLSAIYTYDPYKSFAGDLLDSGLPYDQAYSTWIHTLHRSPYQHDRYLAATLAQDSLSQHALQQRLDLFEQRTKHTRMDSVRLQALSTALIRKEKIQKLQKQRTAEEKAAKEQKRKAFLQENAKPLQPGARQRRSYTPSTPRRTNSTTCPGRRCF